MLKKLLELFPEQEEPKPNKFTRFMGNAIKEAREEQGISQEELAQKIYRRRATLSDMENGKADVDAGTLWLLSAYLQKPLSYFYPPYARENIRPEEMGELEHELLLHFIAIRADELKRLAIRTVKAFEDFDPVDLVRELTPYMEHLEEAKAIRKVKKEYFQKGRT